MGILRYTPDYKVSLLRTFLGNNYGRKVTLSSI
jgi:hypothetical protein